MSKILIYYFSITGNTEYVVETTGKILKSEGEKVFIYNIQEKKEIEENGDLYIFAFPVFAWREPYTFRKFLLNLKKVNKLPAVIVSTYGGIKGNSHWWVKKLLQKKGFNVKGFAGIRAEDSHPVLRRNWTMKFIKTGPPDDKEILNLKERLLFIINSNRRIKIRYNPLYFLLDIIGIFYRPPFIDTWLKKWVIKDLCTGCNRCVGICPESIIELKSYNREKYPVFHRGCIGCYGCINVCPEFAIRSFFVKGGKQYMFRRKR